MLDQVNATLTPHKRLPWNKGKLTGAKPPLRPKHVWSIRTKLQIEGRARDPGHVQSSNRQQASWLRRRRHPGRGRSRRRLYSGSRNRPAKENRAAGKI